MRARDTSSTGATGATSNTANRGAAPGRKLKFGDPEFQRLEKTAEDNILLLKEETKKHYEENFGPDPTGEVRYGGRLLHNRNVCTPEFDRHDGSPLEIKADTMCIGNPQAETL